MYFHTVIPTGNGARTPESMAYQAPYAIMRGGA